MRIDIVNGIPKDAPRWLYETLHMLAQNAESAGAGFAAILRGENPDGSGRPLFNDALYFKLLGRPGGQFAAGDTLASGSLTFSSTNHTTKGFIYFGEAQNSAFDETQGFWGLGTPTPTARLHTHTPEQSINPGTTGTHLWDATSKVSGVTKYWFTAAPYNNTGGVSASNDFAFVVGGTSPGVGAGTIIIMDQALTNGFRFAFGTFGGDVINYFHGQVGSRSPLSPYPTRNNNILFTGFNDNAGEIETHHFQHVNFWYEGDNIGGTSGGDSGWPRWDATAYGGGPGATVFVTTVKPAKFGFNCSTLANQGTTNYYDQPIFTVSGGAWFANYNTVVMRLLTGSRFQDMDDLDSGGSNSYKNVFEITEGRFNGSGRGNLSFAIDQYGRIVFHNPGNGGAGTRLGAYRSDLSLTFPLGSSAVTGASGVLFELGGSNLWTDGGSNANYSVRLGYDELWVTSPVFMTFSRCTRTLSTTSTLAFDRMGFVTKFAMICDGATTPTSGDFEAPTGLLHLKSALVATKRLLVLQRKASQSVDIATVWDSNGSTALSGLDKDGKYYLVSGAAVNKVLYSDANGVGDWSPVRHQVIAFGARGPYQVKVGADGTYVMPVGGTIVSVRFWRGTAGGAGSTILDVNKNGTTLWTTQANRPTITAANGSDYSATVTLPDVTTVAAGDKISMDIDQIESGLNPLDFDLLIEVG